MQKEASIENVKVTFSAPENGDTVADVALVVRSARNCTESKCEPNSVKLGMYDGAVTVMGVLKSMHE